MTGIFRRLQQGVTVHDLYMWLSYDRQVRRPEDIVKLLTEPKLDTDAQIRTWGLFLDWIHQADRELLQKFLQLATGKYEISGNIKIGWRHEREVEEDAESVSTDMLIPCFR